jgi:hypothetical protein
MKSNEYTAQWYGNKKILCSVTHKKTGLSAWGVEGSTPEENKKIAVERCEALVKESKTKHKHKKES